AASVALLSLSLGGCISATTYGTGVSPGQQTIEDITGLVSFAGKKKPQIEYEPRPPIVAPPGKALPPPGESAAATVANWPVDPDKTRTGGATKPANAYGPAPAPDVPVAANPPRLIDNSYDTGKATIDAHNRKGKEQAKIYATAKAAATTTVD